MSTPIESLVAELGKTSAVMAQIDETRSRLQGYRQERQRYADLAATEKASLDALIEASRVQLQALGDQIAAALPKGQPTP